MESGSPRDVHHQVAHLRVGLEVYRLRQDVSGHRQVHRDEQLDDRPLDKHCRPLDKQVCAWDPCVMGLPRAAGP